MTSHAILACKSIVCVLAVICTTDAQQQPMIFGTCASIGYSSACCPPGRDCMATDGNCNCDVSCYTHHDCCQDVSCPRNPRTCRDIGITSCCSDPSGMGLCDVHMSATSSCSCNVTCHRRNDCCPDAQAIGCVPRTCTEAGLGAGCCLGSSPLSCYVSGGDCNCDSYCITFNDCCSDVPRPQCSAGNSFRRSRVQSNLEQQSNNMPSYVHRFKELHSVSRPRAQNVYYDRYYSQRQREAVEARAQRTRANNYPRKY